MKRSITRAKLFFLFVILSLFVPPVVFAGTYWVHPSGSASWASCESATDPGSNYCSLSTANSNVSAGDTVYLKGGTYNVDVASIEPSSSGTLNSRITYRAASGETPEFARISSHTWAVIITGKDYIVVDGIKGTDLARWIYISNGADYNEIKNSTFIGCHPYDTCIRIWDGNGETASTHNWLHNNTFAICGWIDSCNDIASMIKIDDGVPNTNGVSHYNTIEDNLLYGGGHDLTEIYSRYNVIRNNFYHNEGWMTDPGGCGYGPDSNGKYGNRNIQIVDTRYDSSGTYNLIEGNRFGASGAPPDDDGGDSFTLSSQKNILRYNAMFKGQNNGLLMKYADVLSKAHNNRIYNNTIVWNGRYQNYPLGGGGWQGYGVRYYNSILSPSVGSVFKNNIIYGNGSGDISHAAKETYNTSVDNIHINNWLNSYGNPQFVDGTHSDFTSATQPDLRLKSSSGAINGGTHLTQAKGSGSNSTTLVVGDALYFQDGTWGSALAGHKADWIAIGTVSDVVQIISINYSTNTIRLKSPLSWTDKAKIWLYKKSDGVQVLYGSAPDYGAYEYGNPVIPSPPKNLRIFP